ncbi:CoA pyrophosphatase [Vibrio sp. 99-8-1]|uniref:CoA pyrophosphatase n=1 Tax=Vibrio sp. 99-8-1 TaxID=2607602 RepID=UPI001493C2D9|nr:CoA pyrophosphatase [Vibrio sp. 99-8-1]NOI65522.1 CoA pyrophosphatase [Vibrio sp. 99-8-1]
MNKQQLLTQFSLRLPEQYHHEAVNRASSANPNQVRKASVLIGCVERDDQLFVILTRRAKHLKHHPGQISFPGGKYEESDSSLIHTALRETEEEIGIHADQISVVGLLPELMTVSHFMVTPVIALISSDYQIQMDRNEVDDVFEVPASHLFDIKQLYTQVFKINQQRHRVFAVPYNEHFIWGVTAQIIQALQRQLRE